MCAAPLWYWILVFGRRILPLVDTDGSLGASTVLRAFAFSLLSVGSGGKGMHSY